MIHIYHGADDYSMRAALQALRDRLGTGHDPMASNTTVLDGRSLTPGELIANSTAVPFLSESRLVVVEGLLDAIHRAASGNRGGRRKKADVDEALEPWRRAAAHLAEGMPASNTLVLLEGPLSEGKKASTNIALPIFSAIASTTEFAPLRTGDLSQWIQATAGRKGMRIEGHAIAALAGLVGPDLWALDNELERLALYADGAPVTRDMVLEVTSAAQATKVWDLTDAIVAGDETKALASLRSLIAAGQAPQLLLFMIVRQVRQVVVVKDMVDRRSRRDEIARAAGLPDFRVEPMVTLANRFAWDTLRAAYAALLEADLSVKRGLSDDEPALQLVVHRVCALAPRGSAARPQAPLRR
jgi:DNA polymerase-3 subunit delta